MLQRIAIFTASPDYTVRKGVAELQRQLPDTRILVVHHRPSKPLKTLLKNQWRNLKRNGWRWIPYQTSEILQILLGRVRRPHWHSRQAPGADYDMDALLAGSSIELLMTPDIHGTQALQRIQDFNPDLGISLAAPILKASLFEIPRLGTINLHKGKLPDYRGMPPAFWEFWHDEQSFGCTVHQMTAQLDQGDILLEASVPRRPYSTLKGIQLELDEVGIELVARTALQIAQGKSSPKAQQAGGNTFRKPTLQQEAALAKRLKPKAAHSGAVYQVKEAIRYAYTRGFRPWQRLLHRFNGNREVIVLLYHRVNDELRDQVSIGIEHFDRQMAYIAKHYPIASIDDVIHGELPENTGGKPVIAVTFDDGYLDNYEFAFPIVQRHQIPAAFFVSTGMIGEERGFPHDMKMIGRSLPNMNWAQLREMRDAGCTIGSHTVSHLSCGKSDLQEVDAELKASMAKLKQELELKEVIFAYPYGARDDMNPQALELVKQSGYVACLSAYGGVNRNGVDKFNVLRMGVDYKFSELAFQARAEGW